MTMIAASLSAILGFLGMSLLSLAMDRHHEQVWGYAPNPWPRRAGLRLAGGLLLALAAIQAVALQGASIGLTLWIMEIGLAAVIIGLLLSYAPRALPRLVLAALVLLAAALALPEIGPASGEREIRLEKTGGAEKMTELGVMKGRTTGLAKIVLFQTVYFSINDGT